MVKEFWHKAAVPLSPLLIFLLQYWPQCFSMGRTTSTIAPSCGGISTPSNKMVPWAHASQPPNGSSIGIAAYGGLANVTNRRAPVLELRKNSGRVGATLRRRKRWDFDAVFYMGVHYCSGGNPSRPPVIQALTDTRTNHDTPSVLLCNACDPA